MWEEGIYKIVLMRYFVIGELKIAKNAVSYLSSFIFLPNFILDGRENCSFPPLASLFKIVQTQQKTFISNYL